MRKRLRLADKRGAAKGATAKRYHTTAANVSEHLALRGWMRLSRSFADNDRPRKELCQSPNESPKCGEGMHNCRACLAPINRS